MIHLWVFLSPSLLSFGRSFLNQQGKKCEGTKLFYCQEPNELKYMNVITPYQNPRAFCFCYLCFLLQHLHLHPAENTSLLSLTICQGSIIFCGLKQKFHLTHWLIKTFHSHPLTNNNYSNLPHEGTGEKKHLCFAACFASWNTQKRNGLLLGLKNNLLSQKWT